MARGQKPGGKDSGTASAAPKTRRKSTKADEPQTNELSAEDIARYDSTVARHILVQEDENAQLANEVYTDNFFQYLEATGGLGIDPLSDEAVRIQAQYIQKGVHPLDILRRLAANPFVKASDRIAASKTVLEYTVRKIPSQVEVKEGDGAPLLRLTAQQLSKLNDKELDQLESLLRKASVEDKG